MRFGTVAVVGRTNVGKSTFLNAALGTRLAIVSEQPQTTREPLLGVVRRDDSQIAFLDTPGLHQPHNELGRLMNGSARQAARSADVLLFMTERCDVAGAARGAARPDPSNAGLHLVDARLLDELLGTAPCLVVINKVDRIRDKSRLLGVIEALAARHDFAAIIPASVLDAADVSRILDQLTPWLPEGPPGYAEDTLTDRPTTFFIREYVREQILHCATREVPHAVAVSIDSVDSSSRVLVARATVHVEKVGQRKILVGRDGARIRQIGVGARARLEALLGRRVHLQLFVRVTPRWKDVPRQLAELGYVAPDGGPEPSRLAPPRERRGGRRQT